jgi:hypothetical protein
MFVSELFEIRSSASLKNLIFDFQGSVRRYRAARSWYLDVSDQRSGEQIFKECGNKNNCFKFSSLQSILELCEYLWSSMFVTKVMRHFRHY